jgi:hypothetical protein
MPLTERSRHKLYETFTALIDDETAVNGGEPPGEPTRQARWFNRGASRGPNHMYATTGDLAA